MRLMTEGDMAYTWYEKRPVKLHRPPGKAKQGNPVLLDAFFAEARAGSRALAGFELGVALADDIERTLALHDLAVCVAALHGSK